MMLRQGIFGLAALAFVIGLAQTARGDWEGGGGAIFLGRSTSYEGDFIVDSGHNPLVSSSDFETNFQGGFYATLGKELANGHKVVAQYYAIDDWSATHSATTTNGAWLSGSTSLGAAPISSMNSVFTSELSSFEVSLTHARNHWLDCMIGFRWLSIDETISTDFFTTGVPYADYSGYTKNDLYGCQVGADALLIDHGRATVSSVLKGGLYGNDMRYDGSYTNGVSSSVAQSADQFSFVGEFGINGNFFLTDNIQVGTGYQLLLVTGLGLVGEQAAAISGPPVAPEGTAFYHGAFINATVFH